MTTMRRQIRDYVRRLFGLDPGPAPGSREEYQAQKAARLAADAKAWEKREAADRADREYERIVESETLKIRLEQKGSLFPGDW